MASEIDKLEWLHSEITTHLEDIRGCFNAPVHISIIVRNTQRPDGSRDVFLTDDTPEKVIGAIKRIQRGNDGN